MPSFRTSRAALWLVLFALTLTACDTASLDGEGDDAFSSDPAGAFATAAPIDGAYIVILKDAGASKQAVDRQASTAALAVKGNVTHVYSAALSGYAIRTDAAGAATLAARPEVQEVVPDTPMFMSVTQSNAPYNLDRVDQRSLPLNTTYTYTPTGQGVTAYIIDSGIRTSHADFGGRASVGADFIGDGQNGQDCNGHGTHVAGTVGGTTYGVAKGTQLRSVRVFGCTGGSPTSTIIAGIDWVTANAQKPAVANLSLGGSANSAMDQALNNMINSGVTAVVAAGNDYNGDACAKSPARVPAAITVGSTTASDARSDFSNTGSCLDIWAPGSSVLSASHTSNTGSTTKNGTSMASPAVAGAVALYLQGATTASPSTVASAINSAATTGKVTGGGSSPNRLLYTIFTPTPPAFPAPVLSSTYNSNISISLNWTAVTGATSYAIERTNTGERGILADGITQRGTNRTATDAPYYEPDFVRFAPNQFFGFACYQVIATGAPGQTSRSNTVCYGVQNGPGGPGNPL